MKRKVEPGIAEKGFIPLCVPHLSGNEWKYIKECLDTNWVSSAGPFVDKFEKMVADFVKVRYAVACVNGTAALHISLLLLGIHRDDEVITSDLTFVAPANAIRYVGAHPVFIDADYNTFQLDVDKLNYFLKTRTKKTAKGLMNKDTKRYIKAILPVHILGHCCDIESIMEISRNYGLPVIEDATEALGASVKGKFAGTFGKLGVFSFNGNKIITTGGGGMIVTDDPVLAKKAKYLTTQAKDDSVEFIHNEIGYNYRLPNLLSAMGCAQMEKIDAYIEKKREIAKMYNEKLSEIPGIGVMTKPYYCETTFWLYTIKIEEKEYGLNRVNLMKELQKHKIETRPLWQPMHLLKPHKNSPKTVCDVAEKLKKRCLCLPCSVKLAQKEQDFVIEKITSLQKV